jgi:predicted Zn finger-like uncharacterized protein
MPSPSPANVVIACPQCGTRYRLPREALGGGRVVQCAHCQTSWEAAAPDGEPAAAPVPAAQSADEDTMFDPAAEARLDAEFATAAQAAAEAMDATPSGDGIERSIAEIKAAIAPKPVPQAPPDPATISKRMRAFSRRQDSIRRNLPTGRLRRTVRVAAVLGLLVVAACGFALRTEIVRQFPDLAGVYAALGLPVNVIGLEFRDVRTLASLVQGAETLVVNGQIVSAADRWVVVPAVVVTLLNEAGGAIYEWSVTPEARDLEPGEAINFETRLTQPPQGAVRVRLTFTNGRAQPETVAIEPAPAETAS